MAKLVRVRVLMRGKKKRVWKFRMVREELSILKLDKYHNVPYYNPYKNTRLPYKN